MCSLKAVGVFWDIENCHVPRGKSALRIIERIREKFFHDCREAEFICVCDIIKEQDNIIKDLNDGQINVVHVSATAKNAADDKIRQSMRRFSDSHPPGTKVILISSDVNFASDLSDLRHRKKFEVVLIHKHQVNEALLTCANEHYSYEDLTSDLPSCSGQQEIPKTVCVAFGYDKDAAPDKVSAVLKMLSSNCGGKVISIGPLYAILKFGTQELMERAKTRMNGEDVYGRKITVCLPEESPFQLNSKKWTHMSHRNESPSPHRGRRRENSRSYTPEDGWQGGFNRPPSTNHDGRGGSGYTLVPASELPDQRHFRTPGGPVQHGWPGGTTSVTGGGGVSAAAVGSPVSPGSTHTLPNSNSAKYYTSVLSPNDSHRDVSGPENEGKALLRKLTAGANGGGRTGEKGSSPVVSLSAANQQLSLKDIPLPPSGYRHMPPPNMVAAASSQASDPMQLFEKTAQDSQQLWKPGLLGSAPKQPPPNNAGDHNQHFNPAAFFKHPEPAAGGKSSQDPQPAGQPRSLSVPGPAHFPAAEDCRTQGYPPGNYGGSGNHRSHSQGGSAGLTKQEIWQEQQAKGRGRGRHNSGSRRRCSPANKEATNSRPSPNLEQGSSRPYSPSAAPGNVQGFRPRLPSAPISGRPQQRTPSPFSGLQPPVRPLKRPKGSNIYRVPTPVEMSEHGPDYFDPEFRPDVDHYIELVVSNLDYNISPTEWNKIIYTTFRPHVKVLSVQVRLQADNTSVATLRLPTEQDARFAIAQYHRRKIGYKRISVQLKADCSHSPAESLRMDTIALLMEERESKMPLSRLIDLFDKRFHKTVSVSDIYKMRDTVQITDSGGGGRWVKLQPNIRRTPTPTQGPEGEVLDAPSDHHVCPIHCAEGSPQYVEALNTCMLPNVLVLRKHFSPQLHSLLLSHNGYIPLMSFPACYAAEFSPLEAERDGGIPLEHVISCVPGVEICVSKSGIKMIQFQQNREPFYDLMKGSAWQELGKISREVMELLRQQLTCMMPVSKFIPTYHHYFGKQCRVADYGYTKLQELFEAIPHAIQVLGTGDRRAITLSPRAQLKRFTTDIIKVVKAQPTKQIMLDNFPVAYAEVMGKALFLPHYGVCHMEDILNDIPTTTLIVIEEGNHVLLALPRRDQTLDEVERTKKFALEVVDLLKTCPRCCMAFNKFIPAYHHHFGRQCRVSDYGFSKLADLFEAVSHVVRLEDEGEERLIQLTLTEMRSVLIEQMTALLRSAGAIPVDKLQQAFASRYNFALKLTDYGVDTTKELLWQLKHHVTVETYNNQEFAVLVKEFEIPVLGLQVMQLLMDESGGCLPLQELCTRYESTFGRKCDLAEIRDKLGDYIQLEESGNGVGLIRLSLQQSLGRNLRLLMLHRGGQRLPMSELYALYRHQYGVDLSPALYGFPSLYQLLLSFPHILEVRGKPKEKYIVLSSWLSTPGVLPPGRMGVMSPQQSTRIYSDTSPLEQGEMRQADSSDLSDAVFLHAFQLENNVINSQPPISSDQSSSPMTSSTRIMKMLSESTAALRISRAPSEVSPMEAIAKQMPAPAPAPPQSSQPQPALKPALSSSSSLKGDKLSSKGKKNANISKKSAGKGDGCSNSKLVLSNNGVPLAWQMQLPPTGEKIVSGNFSQPTEGKQFISQDCHKMDSPHQDQQGGTDDGLEEAGEELFSSSNLPLDTSSATSQLNSSSQSSISTNSSPVKQRRPNSRIAANFCK